MYVDRWLAGITRYHAAEPKDWRMRIPDFMLHCVALLGYEDAQGQAKYGGTGLFLLLRDEHERVAPRYLVTARHVVTGIPSVPGSGLKHQREAFAEFTSLDDDQFHVSLSDVDWIFPEDDAVDLAICYFPGGNPRNLAIAEESLLGGNELARKGIGIGDETYSISLFGFKQQVISKTPIARIGNIAMLPLMKAPTEFGDTEVYVIEARSLSGFSGAPVFVRQTVNLPSQKDAEGEEFNPNALGYMYLLGLLHGHRELGPQDRGVNTGLAFVVPAEKIKELLASDGFREKKQGHIAREVERRRETQRTAMGRIVMDSAAERHSDE